MLNYRNIKRILDSTLALVALIVLSPLLLLIALFVVADSKGPILFLQERLGLNGRIFRIYKFRTMVDGAINIGMGLHTEDGDPRITRIGNFLRKTSLDELPQLLNVLRGEMSLIGPRPPVPYYPRRYEEYSEAQQKRFSVRPGITGYAQVVLRNSAPWDERIKLDLKYVEEMGVLLDLKILWLTFYALTKHRNIYPPTNGDGLMGKY